MFELTIPDLYKQLDILASIVFVNTYRKWRRKQTGCEYCQWSTDTDER